MFNDLKGNTDKALADLNMGKTFEMWLEKNWTIWERFYESAEQMAAVREHYSARTIIEVMRWNTDLREVDSQFKIGNNVVPKLARLFEAVRPEYSGFFRKRGNNNQDDGIVARKPTEQHTGDVVNLFAVCQ